MLFYHDFRICSGLIEKFNLAMYFSIPFALRRIIGPNAYYSKSHSFDRFAVEIKEERNQGLSQIIFKTTLIGYRKNE